MDLHLLPLANPNAPEKSHNNLPTPVVPVRFPSVRMPPVPPTMRSGPAPATKMPFGMVRPILTSPMKKAQKAAY
jgi:hypothetical protein